VQSQSNPNDTSDNGKWTVQTNKRNLSSSSAPNSPKTPSQPTKKKLIATANRFEVFSQPDNDNDKINDNHNTNMSSNNSDQNNTESTVKSPPHIFIKGVLDFPELCTSLIEILGVDNFSCKSSTDRLKV